jgi:hypothetical protein
VVPAIKGHQTLAQIVEQFDVHLNEVTAWKAQLESSATAVFGPGADQREVAARQIGELTREDDFLRARSPSGVAEREAIVDRPTARRHSSVSRLRAPSPRNDLVVQDT